MQPGCYVFRPRDKTLTLGGTTRIMGVVNVTPDSFSDGGQYLDPLRAADRCLELVGAGADILDLGGESSRPGAVPVSASEEIDRLAPVLEKVRPETAAIISVDTYKPAVAAECLRLGADVINDIFALRWSPAMAPLIARSDAGLVLMHMRGTPGTMQQLPPSQDILRDIVEDLAASVAQARAVGVRDDRLVLDPGIGFGKTLEDNLRILGRLSFLRSLGLPVLVGTSRKSFLGKLGLLPGERLIGTIASVVVAARNGAHIVRVHDVAEVRQALRVTDALAAEGTGNGK
jgi:dihydropteroate synthase